MQRPWPDYVFDKDYTLIPLSELERFVKVNKHLPDVPSSDEIAENGLALGEMNAILLKKIEELTLHVIELNKNNALLSNDNAQMKKELSEIRSLIIQLSEK